ncbi:MAG: hypothetical protein IPO05_13970 [Flavobacteriales bacterium]|nr:hypothetical protein [Flavobacteriales bacterium]
MTRSSLPYFSGSMMGLVTMALLSILTLGCLGSKQDRSIAKVGRHMQRIHEAEYAYSLRKATSSWTAARMHKEVEGIRKQFDVIADTAAIKEPLRAFLERWPTAERIEGSLIDGEQAFMSAVTGFYLRGLVQRKEGAKTMFPIRRP